MRMQRTLRLAAFGIAFAVCAMGALAGEDGFERERDGGEAQACAFVEVVSQGREFYGVGMDANIVTASIKAIVSGVHRSREYAGEEVAQLSA